MAKKGCIIPQAPDGSTSKLYLDLKKELNDNRLANYIYAMYTALNIGEKMDNDTTHNYTRDKHKEHHAREVLKFLSVKDILHEQSFSLMNAMKEAKAVDSSGVRIDYDTATEALEKAKEFNDKTNSSGEKEHKGRVAYVAQNGNKFNIIVEDLGSLSQVRPLEVDEALKSWTTMSDAFRNKGIDINEFNDLSLSANALSTEQFIRHLNNLSITDNKYLTEKELKTILLMNPNETLVQQAVKRFGDIDTVAHTIYQYYHGGSLPAGVASFLENTLNTAKKSDNMTVLPNQIAEQLALDTIDLRANRKEGTIQEELDKMYEKYGLKVDEFKITSKTIHSMTEATEHAAMTLQRQINFLKKQQGRTEQGKKLEQNLDTLLKELQSKKYKKGLLTFLEDGLKYASTIKDQLDTIENTGDRKQYCMQAANALANAKKMQAGYKFIVDALANMDNRRFIINEGITDADFMELQQKAIEVRKILDEEISAINDVQRDFMVNALMEVLGTQAYETLDVTNLLTIAKQDSSWLDYLWYSGSRVSNPLLAAMNTVTSDATRHKKFLQDQYTRELRRIELEFRKNGGQDTSFMTFNIKEITGATEKVNSEWVRVDNLISLEKSMNTYKIGSRGYEYRIISEEGIDWGKYNQAKARARYKFQTEDKLSGFELIAAMEEWEENNTQEKIVDEKTGRTERIPNDTYWDASIKALFDGLTDTQKKYYRDMMKLKGEIGSLLPHYAQDQYRPIQIREEFLDLLDSTIKGKISKMDAAKTILDRMRIFKVRSDDNFFNSNGLITSEGEVCLTESDFNGALIKQIPIFYFNKLENQSELKQNFSCGMAHLIGTAVNFNALDEVVNIVETMGDFIKNQDVRATFEDAPAVSEVSNGFVRIIQDVAKVFHASTRTSQMVDSFINRDFYGKRMFTENKKLVNVARKLIVYNSVKGLAVNVKGATVNELVGEYGILRKSLANIGKTENVDWNFNDYLKASLILLGDKTLRIPGHLMDFFTNSRNSKDTLVMEMFDPTSDDSGEQGSLKFYHNPLRKILGGFNWMGLYKAGEEIIHKKVMYAMLCHQKVWMRMEDGSMKKVDLYDGLQVSEKERGNSELLYDHLYLDEAGTQKVTMDYLQTLKDRIRGNNQDLHGAMAEEDKGLIHSRIAGKLVMNFRQWMVEHYSSRFRGQHWDGAYKEVRSGFKTESAKSLIKLTKNLMNDWFSTAFEGTTKLSELSPREREALREYLAAGVIFGLLSFGKWQLPPAKDIGKGDDKWETKLKKFLAFVLLRLWTDIFASTIPGMFMTWKTMINSPIPAINTINGLLYPVWGIQDIGEKYQKGDLKGKGKYIEKMKKYSLPFYWQIYQLQHMDTQDQIFGQFDFSQSLRY